ncbi:MAG: sensor histidine kinase [Bacteroidota bacterium]
MNTKRLFFVCIWWLGISPLVAQPYMDSLKALIDVPQRDTSHIWDMMHVAWRYAFSYPDSGDMLCREASQIALSVRDQSSTLPHLSKVYIVHATVFINQGQLDSAIRYNQLSLDIKRQLKDTSGIAAGLNNIAVIEQFRGNYESALALQLEALDIREQARDTLNAARGKFNIGRIYFFMERYEDALVTLKNSLSEMPKEALKAGEEGMGWQSIGTCFLKLDQLDSAELYLLKAKDISEQHQDIRNLASTYTSLSSLYFKQDRLSQAIQAIEQSIDIHAGQNNTEGLAMGYAKLGSYQAKDDQTSQAATSFRKSLELAQQGGFREVESSTLRFMGELYMNQKKYGPATEALLAHIKLSDSIRGARVTQQIAEMQTRYETEKKEQQIVLQELQIENQNQRNTRTLLLAGSGGLLMLLIGGGAFFRLQERRQYEQRLQELKLKAEKERISRDLHDHVGAQLTAITTKLNLLGMKAQRNQEPVEVATIEQLDEHARETIGLLRDTIWAIKQEDIDLEGLGRKLRQYVHRYLDGMDTPKWEVHVTGNVPLSPQQGLTLFRIIQEGVQNVVKHAHAQSLSIKLEAASSVIVTLVDDGIGFKMLENDGYVHYGLQNMQARAEEIDAQLKIDSAPNRGTQLTIELDSQA